MVASVVDDFREETRLIARVLRELRRNGRASPSYHALVQELSTLKHALHQLSRLQPTHHEFIRLEAIRAMATRSRGPLEVFLAKLHMQAEIVPGLHGSHKSSRSSLSIIQWSTQHQRDILELRSSLSPLVGTINLLLLTETVNTLSVSGEEPQLKVEDSRQLPTRPVPYCTTCISRINSAPAADGASQYGDYRTRSKLSQVPECSTAERAVDEQEESWVIVDDDAALSRIQSNASQLEKDQTPVRDPISLVTSHSGPSESMMQTVLSRLLELLRKTTHGALRLRAILAKLEELFEILTAFTSEMREAVTRLMTIFQDIHTLLVRLNAQLPKPIDFPIVQFSDAFGNKMPFPLHLSQKWITFHTMVYAAFIGKQGKWRVENGHFSIYHARLRRYISPTTWDDTIQDGDKLSMSIIIQEHTLVEARCPWPSCCSGLNSLELEHGGSVACPRCHRWIAIPDIEKFPAPPALASTTRQNSFPLAEPKTVSQSYEPRERGSIDIGRRPSLEEALVEPELVEDLDLYRFIQIPIHGYDTCGALRAGACFVGTQSDDWGSCDVEVSISTVSIADSFLSGYLRFKNLVQTYPSVTTYFDAEIIGTHYNFHTPHPDWGSDARADLKQWREFQSWDSREEEQLVRLTRRRRRRSSVESIDLLDVQDPQWWKKRYVYMRWKERSMVHPTTKPDPREFNFDGFYYICFDQEEATIQGVYYQPNLVRDIRLNLKHHSRPL